MGAVRRGPETVRFPDWSEIRGVLMPGDDHVPETLVRHVIRPAAEVLGRAFDDDPLMNYLVAGKGPVFRRALRFFEASIRLGMARGEVQALPSTAGVAVWLSPGTGKVGFGAMLRSGMFGATLGMGVRSIRRFGNLYRYIEPLEDQNVPGPHWVLMFIGVDPELQGKGLGHALISPVLERADAEGLPCYLDTGNPRNLSFYHRHGFGVVDEVELPDGPTAWAMVRQPRTN